MEYTDDGLIKGSGNHAWKPGSDKKCTNWKVGCDQCRHMSIYIYTVCLYIYIYIYINIIFTSHTYVMWRDVMYCDVVWCEVTWCDVCKCASMKVCGYACMHLCMLHACIWYMRAYDICMHDIIRSLDNRIYTYSFETMCSFQGKNALWSQMVERKVREVNVFSCVISIWDGTTGNGWHMLSMAISGT